MPYWRLFYHFTWSTKGRLPVIQAIWMPNLHNVIAAKAQQLGAFVYAVGGTEDHIHMAASVPPGLSLAHFAGQMKGNSSHWVNHVVVADAQFAWQDDHGVLSFGAKQLDLVVKYVKNQAQHHHEGTTIALMERVETERDCMIGAQIHDALVRSR